MELIILIVVSVIVFIQLGNVRKRVSKLEQSVKGSVIVGEEQRVYTEKAQASVIPSSAVYQPNMPGKAGPSIFEPFILWLKEEWLLKLGVALLIIGFGWLTTYAFTNGWIGPMGQITIGIIAGALFIFLGWWRIKKYIHQGGIFLVLGSTVILLTVFAAREVYGFFTPTSALAVMFLSTAFVAAASVKYNSRALAMSSLILAGIAPLLRGGYGSSYVELYMYLLVVVLGTIWVVALTGRRELTAAALAIVSLYSIPHFVSYTSADKGVMLVFAYIFVMMFFVTNIAGILKSRDKSIVLDLVTAAGNGLFLLAWIMIAAPDEWKSLIISTWMVVFTAGAFLMYKATQIRGLFYVYAGVGIAMLAAATAAELNGSSLVIAYTIESVLIGILTYIILRDIKIARKISLVVIGPILLSFESFGWYERSSVVFNDNFFVIFILGVTLMGLGLFFSMRQNEEEDGRLHHLSAFYLVIGSIYLYILLWLSLHIGMQNNNEAVTVSLVVYTIIGLVTYFYGRARGKRGLQVYGGLLVGFVVGRLLLVDVWRMEIAGKIVTFFLVGTLLASTAFLKNKLYSGLVDTE